METTYQIGGMHCEHCVAHVKEEITQIPGVTAATLDLKDALLVVEASDPIGFDVIQAAVEEAGDYTVTAV